MFQQIFCVIEATYPDGRKSYFGKREKEIQSESMKNGLYMKDHGFDSVVEASQSINKLEKYFKHLNIEWRGMDIKDVKVIFSDEDAKKFGYKPFLNFY